MAPKDIQAMMDIFTGIGITVVAVFIVVGVITILNKLMD